MNRQTSSHWLFTLVLVSIFGLQGCTLKGKIHNPEPTANEPVQSNNPHAMNNIQAKPQWFSCNQHSDCAVEPGPCGTLESVNKNFLEPFQAYRNQLNPSLDCKASPNPSSNTESQCVQKRCTVKAR